MEDPVAFVKKHGVVLEGARGSVPNLAEAVAGETIRGSWWGHKRGKAIFHASRAVRDSDEILVCRLIGGRITYVHRRLWPALVRLATLFSREGTKRLDAVREIHTPSGAHKLEPLAFRRWVTPEIRDEAERLSEDEAIRQFGPWMRSCMQNAVTSRSVRIRQADLSRDRKKPG